MKKLTPAQQFFVAHYRRVYGNKWFFPTTRTNHKIAHRLVEKHILEMRFNKVFGRYEFRFMEES